MNSLTRVGEVGGDSTLTRPSVLADLWWVAGYTRKMDPVKSRWQKQFPNKHSETINNNGSFAFQLMRVIHRAQIE